MRMVYITAFFLDEFYRTFGKKETLRLNFLISLLVLKQESWNSWRNRSAIRTNSKQVNLTQKETRMFHDNRKKTLAGIILE